MKRPLLLPALFLTSAPLLAAEAALDAKSVEFFEKNVRPVLVANCYSCHSEATKSKGGLLLDSRENLLRGGGSGQVFNHADPEKSLFYQAISFKDPERQMPPGGKLPNEQIKALLEWMRMGAPDPRDKAPQGKPGGPPVLSGMTSKARAHWSFQPIKKIELPEPPQDAKWRAWAKNPVDRFVLARLMQRQILPSEPAPREQLLRRASYNMTGLPPSTMEVKAFLNDKSANAWEKVVDRLLNSPHYGERWGRHWLDSARYSDTTGNQDEGRGNLDDYRFAYAWTYRDYVIKSLNEDKPYNQFLIEQIAADRLPDIKPGDSRLAALGFLTVGKRFANTDDTIDERIDAISKSTMALTVSCARCHDHKFDPIPTADYYAFHGVFSSLYEPREKPQLPEEIQSEEDDKVQFAMKLATLEGRNRDAMYRILRERLTQFQDSAQGYLLVAVLPGRSPERMDAAKRFKINPDEREIFQSLRMNADHPVLGPFAQLARVQGEKFSERAAEMLPKILNDPKRKVNPLVAATLRELKPQTLEDVAKAYHTLFAKAKAATPEYFKARSTQGVLDVKVDKDLEQLIHTPYFIPAADDVNTAAQQVDYFNSRKLMKEPWQGAIQLDGSERRLLFAAINELKLTEKGVIPAAMVINDSARPQNSKIFIRGERSKLGAEVPRRTLEIIAGPNPKPFKEGSGRLELARSIADKGNPLTSRVLVNRVWMHHFGEGFVRSPDDFGNMAERPSHPELLDYLSTWFMDRGWSVKQLHRLILMSNTYQQDSETRFEGEEGDPENRLLWRSNMRRLDFESIRDSMLMLTGKIDPRIGGQPVNITDEPYSYRRSVYGFVDRVNLSDLMSQFDFANPEMTNSKRISTIVPQQALFFMNNALPIEVARQVMARKDVKVCPDDATRVTQIYQVLFQRNPKEKEYQLAANFIEKATKEFEKRPPVVAKDPKPKLAPPKHVGTMMMEMDPKAEMDMSKMSEMSRNKFAVMRNEGELIDRSPLSPWELYVQALLYSNEFVYVN